MNAFPHPPLSPPSISSDRPGAGPTSPPSSGAPSPKFPPHNARPPYGRANLPTPPISTGSANGMNGYGPPGMNGPPSRAGTFGGGSGAPSPPSSVGRSSNGTQLSDMRPDKRAAMEKILRKHFIALTAFLGATIEEEVRNGRPNRARDKLVRLSPVQFQELSEDVFDELERRRDERGGGPNFLVPDQKLHPKRNQARQKLSTLPYPRFRALSSDVYFEVVRRFPHFRPRMGSPGGPPSRLGSPGPAGMRPGSRGQMRGPPPRSGSMGGPVMGPGMGPMQKSSQSSTAVPNKSYLVEDDDGDMDSLYNRRDTTQTTRSFAANDKLLTEYQNKIDDLNDRIKTLEQDTLDKEDKISKLEGSQRNSEAETEWARLRTSLEDKVADAQALNESLHADLDKLKQQHRDREDDLQNQIDIITRKSNDDGEWRARYNDAQQESNGVKRENQDLQEALKEAQQSTGSVRKELQGFLAELKVLQDRGDQGFQREERLSSQVEMLELDVKAWKSRCAKMKTQLHTAHAGAALLTQPDALGGGRAFARPGGLVEHVHLTLFQQAVDETLRSARGADPAALQSALKGTVSAVRDLCGDVPASNPDAQKARAKASALANNLITATKNFIASRGISPVTLLDAAASNLSTAVVDLVASAGLKPGTEDLDLSGVPEEDDSAADLDMIIPEPSAAGARDLRPFSANGRSSRSDSVYSVTTAAARASERFQTLPMSTYQDPRSSRAPSANGGAYAPAARFGAAPPQGHRPQLSIASQSSYNSQAPPFAGRPSFGGAASSDSSRRPSVASGQAPPINFSNSSVGTAATGRSLAPPVNYGAPKSASDQDPALIALSRNLDIESAKLTEASNGLVDNMRNKDHSPQSVVTQVQDIVGLLGAILSQTSPELERSTTVQGVIGGIVDNIENATKTLNGMAVNAQQVIKKGKGGTDDWRDSIRQIPTLVFSVGREVRSLSANVKQVADNAIMEDSEDDFR